MSKPAVSPRYGALRRRAARFGFGLLASLALAAPAGAETPEDWIRLGARVHGAFGSFIPLGIRIGEAALKALDEKPRGVKVLYYDGARAPCACIADGVALATIASVGQRTLTIAPQPAPAGDLARVVVTSKTSGRTVTYVVRDAVLPKLVDMNRTLDERGRYTAVMSAEGLFEIAP